MYYCFGIVSIIIAVLHGILHTVANGYYLALLGCFNSSYITDDPSNNIIIANTVRINSPIGSIYKPLIIYTNSNVNKIIRNANNMPINTEFVISPKNDYIVPGDIILLITTYSGTNIRAIAQVTSVNTNHNIKAEIIIVIAPATYHAPSLVSDAFFVEYKMAYFDIKTIAIIHIMVVIIEIIPTT